MIYIVYGDDDFRKSQEIATLKHELLSPGLEALNYSELKKPNIAELISTISVPAFASGMKVILIKEASFLEQKCEDKDGEKILAALEDLPESNCVIFDNKKILGTLKLVKKIKKFDQRLCKIRECKSFAPWETGIAAEWLMTISGKNKAIKCKLDKSTAEFFAEHIGSSDSANLFSELQRLALLNEEISKELIEKECKSKNDLFKFCKLLAAGSRNQAQEELQKLKRDEQINLGTLAAMEGSISLYYKLKLLEQSREAEYRNKDAQAKFLGVSPGRLYFLKQESAAMRTEQLESLRKNILKIERKVKSGKQDLSQALSLLVHS